MGLLVVTLGFGNSQSGKALSKLETDFFLKIAGYCRDSMSDEGVRSIFVPISFSSRNTTISLKKTIRNALPGNISEYPTVIIDASSKVDGTSIHTDSKFWSAMSSTIYETIFEGNSEINCIFLVEKLPAADEVYMEFAQIADEKKFAVIDSHGAVILRPAFLEGYSAGAYMTGYKKCFGYNIVDIENKIVERVGFFQIRGFAGVKLAHHFFDCSSCITPISYVLIDKITQQLRESTWNNSNTAILAIDIGSSWIKDVSDRLAEIIETREMNVRLFRCSELGSDLSCLNMPKIIIILPMVESGDELSMIVRRLKEFQPDVELEIFSVLSMLGSEEQRECVIDEGRISFRFLAHVNNRRNLSGSFSKLSNFERHIVSTDARFEPTTFLTPIEFWMMAFEAEFESEIAIPRGRIGIGFVPKFKRMVDTNRRLIAQKLYSQLEYSRQTEFLLVSPQEESAASSLAAAMEELFEIETVLIPRNVIDDVFANPSLLKELISKDVYQNESWFIRLNEWKSRNNNNSVFLLDEFQITGSTTLRLKNLLDEMGIGVDSLITPLVFSNTDRLKSINVRQLYTINFGLGERYAS